MGPRLVCSTLVVKTFEEMVSGTGVLVGRFTAYLRARMIAPMSPAPRPTFQSRFCFSFSGMKILEGKSDFPFPGLYHANAFCASMADYRGGIGFGCDNRH